MERVGRSPIRMPRAKADVMVREEGMARAALLAEVSPEVEARQEGAVTKAANSREDRTKKAAAVASRAGNRAGSKGLRVLSPGNRANLVSRGDNLVNNPDNRAASQAGSRDLLAVSQGHRVAAAAVGAIRSA